MLKGTYVHRLSWGNQHYYIYVDKVKNIICGPDGTEEILPSQDILGNDWAIRES